MDKLINLNGRNSLDVNCDHCGLSVTPEGHDGCLGELPYPVMNACCGHGSLELAYIQFDHPEYKTDPNRNHPRTTKTNVKKIE